MPEKTLCSPYLCHGRARVKLCDHGAGQHSLWKSQNILLRSWPHLHCDKTEDVPRTNSTSGEPMSNMRKPYLPVIYYVLPKWFCVNFAPLMLEMEICCFSLTETTEMPSKRHHNVLTDCPLMTSHCTVQEIAPTSFPPKCKYHASCLAKII